MNTVNLLQSPALSVEEMQHLASVRASLVARLEAVAAQKAELDARLIAGMQAAGIKSVEDPASGVKLTWTAATRTTIDPELVEANVGRGTWMKISKRVLDTTMWAHAVGLGRIKPEVIEMVTRVSEKAVMPLLANT